MMYVQDYDERYPISVFTSTQVPPNGSWYSTGGNYTWFWPQIIYPYTKSDQLYYCPNGNSAVKPYSANYGVNSQLINRYAPVSLAAVDAPATTYMAMDAGSYYLQIDNSTDYVNSPSGNFWYVPGSQKYTSCPTTGCNSTYPFTGFTLSDFNSEGRHFDGNNIIYADGHAKWTKTSIMMSEARKFKAGSYAKSVDSNWNPANNN